MQSMNAGMNGGRPKTHDVYGWSYGTLETPSFADSAVPADQTSERSRPVLR